jgi:hypothetical protein
MSTNGERRAKYASAELAKLAEVVEKNPRKKDLTKNKPSSTFH